MSKTLIGIVSFGNLPFTKLTIEEIERTTTKPIEFFIVVGKPGDVDTEKYLVDRKIPHVVHKDNYGFPYSLNDIYDRAFKNSDYDNLIIAGNDVIAYPTTIDALIETADTTKYGWISACQYDVKSLVRDYPDTARYFDVNRNYAFKDFNTRPWDAFKGFDQPKTPAQPGLSDIHNLALYKKVVYDVIGLVDVGFYPAYYSDNDYARRGVNAGLADISCTLSGAYYFHFWSRTIHQGSGGSNGQFFNNNRMYYILKWGGDFGSERFKVPFGGNKFTLPKSDIVLNADIKISSRENELQVIDFWRKPFGG